MENWAVALFIFGAVAVGMIGQGWVSFLDHQRRTQTLELIKAMLAAERNRRSNCTINWRRPISRRRHGAKWWFSQRSHSGSGWRFSMPMAGGAPRFSSLPHR